MPPRAPERFRSDLLQVLGQLVKSRFQNATKSKTLRAAWRVLPDQARPATRILVFVPHYWAWAYFLGRRAVSPVTAKKLVWFVDPREDPRLQPLPPVRLSERRRLRLPLSRFRELLRQGKLVVRDRAGPAPPQFGFLAEVRRVPSTLAPVIRQLTADYIRELPPVQPQGGRVAVVRL